MLRWGLEMSRQTGSLLPCPALPCGSFCWPDASDGGADGLGSLSCPCPWQSRVGPLLLPTGRVEGNMNLHLT